MSEHGPLSARDTGLVLLYVGDDAGTTAAALGQVFRSAGRGFSTCFIRFATGMSERQAFPPADLSITGLEFHQVQQGDASSSEDVERHVRAGWDLACVKIASGKYDLIVLDQVTQMVARGLITESEISREISARADKVNIIISGPHAPQSLVSLADLVTEVGVRRQ